MKALTLRNVPLEVARFIRRKADQENMSLNKTVIRLLEDCTGHQGRKQSRPLHHDLDALAGSWSKEEARKFEQSLKRQRPIDKDLWK